MPTRSLLERLAELTDPRDPKGRVYPFVPLLALCLVGILAGNTSLAAIAHFGRLRGRRLGHALGFPHGRMPCANTLANLLAHLDPDQLDRFLRQWLNDRHVEASTNEHKAALGCCRSPERSSPPTQGHYVLYAKGNQARLKEDIQAVFAAAESGGFSPPRSRRIGAKTPGRPGVGVRVTAGSSVGRSRRAPGSTAIGRTGRG